MIWLCQKGSSSHPSSIDRESAVIGSAEPASPPTISRRHSERRSSMRSMNIACGRHREQPAGHRLCHRHALSLGGWRRSTTAPARSSTSSAHIRARSRSESRPCRIAASRTFRAGAPIHSRCSRSRLALQPMRPRSMPGFQNTVCWGNGFSDIRTSSRRSRELPAWLAKQSELASVLITRGNPPFSEVVARPKGLRLSHCLNRLAKLRNRFAGTEICGVPSGLASGRGAA